MKGWGTVNEIKVKLAQGKTVSEVARELSIDRKTVRKYRDQTMEEIAGEREADQKRRQKLDDYKDWIKSRVKRMAEDGVINAEAIYHELEKLGYAGSARSVRRFVEGLRPAFRPSRVYRRFETPPGRQAMVDLAEKRGVRIGDRRRTIYFVAMVLSSSRHKYVEWFDRPVDTEMLLAFHESAFRYFEGMPREIVYDQTKLAVLAEHYGEVEFNQAFYSYVQWRHIEPYICHKSDPETKDQSAYCTPLCRFDGHWGKRRRSSKRFPGQGIGRAPVMGASRMSSRSLTRRASRTPSMAKLLTV